jgi:predicted DNA-binding transcriptional regulator
MALKGNLRDFTFSQLLNLINLAAKTGTLVIEGSGDIARVFFREGKLSYAQIGAEDSGLAAILQRTNRISTSQYRILAERARMMSDKELGLLLINAGYLSQQDILDSLTQYIVEVVRQLFTWAEGFFHFEPDEVSPNGKIPVRIDLENLIIEGTRQLQEWEALQEEIPSLDMALKFTERPGANISNMNLNVEEWRVVSYVSPQNSIRQIAQATHLSDLEIRRVVYSLLQAGLVEIIRPGGVGGPVITSKMFPTENPDEQKSLVNRLIDRISRI